MSGPRRKRVRHTWLAAARAHQLTLMLVQAQSRLNQFRKHFRRRWSDALVSFSHPPAMPLRPDPDEQPAAPSAPWRVGSTVVMGVVGLLCGGFLGMSKTESHGLDKFLKLLDERADVENRQRGLITGMRPALASLCTAIDYCSVEPCLRVRTFPRNDDSDELQLIQTGTVLTIQ